MYTATIHTYDGEPIERVTARGRTELAALRNAAMRLLGHRVYDLYVERPVPGATTRYVQEAWPVQGGLSLGPRMIAHVEHA